MKEGVLTEANKEFGQTKSGTKILDENQTTGHFKGVLIYQWLKFLIQFLCNEKVCIFAGKWTSESNVTEPHMNKIKVESHC